MQKIKSNLLDFKRKITKTDLLVILFCCILTAPFFYQDFEIYYQRKGLIRFIFYSIFQFIGPLIIVYILVYLLLPLFLKRKNIFLFILIFLLILTVHAFFTRFIYSIISGKTPHFTVDNITTEMQFTIMLAAPISMMLFIKHFMNTQNQLVIIEKEKKEAELKLLKQQIDPHFLFNNLNVLGALIQQDKVVAGEYLKRFSNLYRYIIRHKDEDIVLLEDEFQFTEDYIYLLKQRFGNAYNFDDFKNLNRSCLTTKYVPPGAFQTLIENMVKHNQGDEANPLTLKVTMDDYYLEVKNEIRTKLTSISSTKTGLNNLQSRYRLLSDKELVVSNLNNIFLVKIPLLKAV